MGRSFSLLLLVGRGIIIGGSDKFSVDPKLKVKVKKSKAENESESIGIIIRGSYKFSVDPNPKVKLKMKIKKGKVKVAASLLLAAIISQLIHS